MNVVLTKKVENGKNSLKKSKSRRSLWCKHKRKLKVDRTIGNIDEKELHKIPVISPFGSI
jgi:hypothetical protein